MRPPTILRHCALGFGALWLAACADSGSDDAARCEAARAHVEACLGVTVDADACDVAAADATVEQDCASLADPGKADLFGHALCSLGVLSACSVATCPAAAPAVTCADYIGREDCTQCDYYLCRDAAAPASCGADGYYEGFGHAYCLRYLEVTTPRMSPAGQQFLHDVRRCLMNVMEAEIPTSATCAAVSQAGFDSHPRCYVMSGFCDLPVSDWWRVLATISPADVSFRQLLTTGLGCLANRTSRLR